MEKHVRFEEPVLFERIEQLLPREELVSLGKAIVEAERSGGH